MQDGRQVVGKKGGFGSDGHSFSAVAAVVNGGAVWLWTRGDRWAGGVVVWWVCRSGGCRRNVAVETER
jgi:hypothetical protein